MRNYFNNPPIDEEESLEMQPPVPHNYLKPQNTSKPPTLDNEASDIKIK